MILKRRRLSKITRKRISESLKGRKRSKEHGKNLARALKGRRLSKEHKNNISLNHANFDGKNHPMWGRHHSKKAKRKISKAVAKNIGKLASNWQGGLSFRSYSIKFNLKLRDKIRRRDHNVCQLCSKRKYNKELAVHHIDYNKKNYKESNLISLHTKCNTEVNANRDYWYA